MAHSRIYDKSIPANTERMGLGTQELRNMKVDHSERMELDHYWGVETDTSLAGADGYHKKFKMGSIATPTAKTDAVILYSKDAPTVAELHCIDEDSNDIKVTSNGKININSNIYMPSVFIAVNSSPQTITKSTNTQVLFQAESYDMSSEYNISSSKFIPTLNGKYLFSCNLGVSSSTFSMDTYTSISGGSYGPFYCQWDIDVTISILVNGLSHVSRDFNYVVFFPWYTAAGDLFDRPGVGGGVYGWGYYGSNENNFMSINGAIDLMAGDEVTVQINGAAKKIQQFSIVSSGDYGDSFSGPAIVLGTYDIIVGSNSKFHGARIC